MRLPHAALALCLLASLQGTAKSQESYDAGGYMGGTAVGTSNSGSDQLYPYDATEPWLHGYWQDMPYYGGYKHFRPYNYKAVLSQSQTAAGWGMNPRMPYSQQFWHRYHQQAAISPYEAFGYATGQGSVHYPNAIPGVTNGTPSYSQPLAPVHSQPAMPHHAPDHNHHVPPQMAPQQMEPQHAPHQSSPGHADPHSMPAHPPAAAPAHSHHAMMPNMYTAPISYPTYYNPGQLPAPVYSHPQIMPGY